MLTGIFYLSLKIFCAIITLLSLNLVSLTDFAGEEGGEWRGEYAHYVRGECSRQFGRHVRRRTRVALLIEKTQRQAAVTSRITPSD